MSSKAFSCSLQVQSLDDLSSRDNMGHRCFERLLFCSPQSWFKPDATDDWWAQTSRLLQNAECTWHACATAQSQSCNNAHSVAFLK